jgi:hypothetical protein
MGLTTVNGGVVASLAIPASAGPVRLFVDCRRAPSGAGGPDVAGFSLHVRWTRSAGMIKSPASATTERAVVEFDADGAVDLPEGCGTLDLLGGTGAYYAAIYDVVPLAPGCYTPRRRQLARVCDATHLRFDIPQQHERLGASSGNGGPVVATSDGIASVLTTTPEACVAGQSYTLGAPARIFTETVVF